MSDAISAMNTGDFNEFGEYVLDNWQL